MHTAALGNALGRLFLSWSCLSLGRAASELIAASRFSSRLVAEHKLSHPEAVGRRVFAQKPLWEAGSDAAASAWAALPLPLVPSLPWGAWVAALLCSAPSFGGFLLRKTPSGWSQGEKCLRSLINNVTVCSCPSSWVLH